jgi:hypothetical protein
MHFTTSVELKEKEEYDVSANDRRETGQPAVPPLRMASYLYAKSNFNSFLS